MGVVLCTITPVCGARVNDLNKRNMKRPRLEDYKPSEIYDGQDLADWYKSYYLNLEKYVDQLEQMNSSYNIHNVSNCKTEPKLVKLETELVKLQKVHGDIVKYFNVHSGCDSFKFKDGAVYRVKLERSFGKATLD